jgi:hypothetical protein
VQVGLVQGKHLSVDGSFVEANTAQVKQTVRQYLVELEQQNPTAEPVHEQDQLSTTDPDSTYATKGGSNTMPQPPPPHSLRPARGYLP